MYSTIDGVKRKITDELYDDTVIDDLVTDSDVDTVAWVNSAVRRAVDFTELELTTTDDVIRLASDCFCAFRIMSEMMEGTNIDSESLATVRYDEAKTYIRMWCANNDVIPAFDDLYVPSAATSGVTTEVHTDFACAIGSDDVCIG